MMICTLLLAYFDFCAVWFFLSKIEFVPANFVIIQITDFSCWFILRFPRPYNVFQGHVITPQLVHYQWVVPLGYLFSFSCLRQLIHPQSLGPLLTKQNNYFGLLQNFKTTKRFKTFENYLFWSFVNKNSKWDNIFTSLR